MQKKRNKFSKKESVLISIYKKIKSRQKSGFQNTKLLTTGFTLIELLVVVAIIGILSSVVVVSINAAREKGNVAAIKTTLKQLYNQAQINYTLNGSYSGSNSLNSNLTCIGNLEPIAKTLIDRGVFVKCYSFNMPSYKDVYTRFGATALIYDAGELKAWSVDENGVVKWDTKGVNHLNQYVTPDVYMFMTKTVATNACAAVGGRLPSVEQITTLSHAWREASGNTTYLPFGFQAGYFYWSSSFVPSDPSKTYGQSMNGSLMSTYSDSANGWTRCVK